MPMIPPVAIQAHEATLKLAPAPLAGRHHAPRPLLTPGLTLALTRLASRRFRREILRRSP
jgi:hypothetical protein